MDCLWIVSGWRNCQGYSFGLEQMIVYDQPERRDFGGIFFLAALVSTGSRANPPLARSIPLGDARKMGD